MKMIVGLGNPGAKYTGTRHNVGFDVVAELEARCSIGKSKKKFQGRFAEAQLGGEQVGLLRPETFMNLSGACVQPARDFYRVADEDLLIVCDDFQLPLAQLRVRGQGSSGGQKGLADILRRLGNQAIPRLRIGIGPPPENWDVADYVLSRFAPEESTQVRQAVLRAADAATDWVQHGLAYCMNRYNQTVEDRSK